MNRAGEPEEREEKDRSRTPGGIFLILLPLPFSCLCPPSFSPCSSSLISPSTLLTSPSCPVSPPCSPCSSLLPPHLVSNLLPLLSPQSSLPFLSDPSATSSPASLPCSSFHAPRSMLQMQNTTINIETPGKGDQKVRKRMNSCPPLAPCDRQWGMPRIMMPCTIF